MENNENLEKKLDETNNDNIDEINEESNELIETNKDLLNEEVEEAIDEIELDSYWNPLSYINIISKFFYKIKSALFFWH